jgi:hypothetical protein
VTEAEVIDAALRAMLDIPPGTRQPGNQCTYCGACLTDAVAYELHRCPGVVYAMQRRLRHPLPIRSRR